MSKDLPHAAVRPSRRHALTSLAQAALEVQDLPALTRLLTERLPHALGAKDARLLLWDRRLETFEAVELADGRRLRTYRPQGGDEGPRPRWLLSDGQLIETPRHEGDGLLVPLLARGGLAGTLVVGKAPRRRCPVTRAEARLVSVIAARAALALENHAYQRELIASERVAALGTMAGMLLHDLRGPLTVIRGYAETLTEPGVPPAEVAERARLVVEAADRLERMASEMLDFARGAERLVLRSVPLGLLLAELCASLEQELPGLSVVRDVAVPGASRFLLDVDKLRRAVTNIAANARDAMGGRGRLWVAARVAGPVAGAPHLLVLELADEGPGVAAEIRERVFEPFVTHGKKRGTGLGLAVARRFVEDHGGSVELLAPGEPPASGARFRLTLPLREAGAARAAR